MPNTATAKNSELLIPAAPMAAGPSGPTMMVSTMPMLIQPISAITTGPASRRRAASSRRMRGPRAALRAQHGDGLLERGQLDRLGEMDLESGFDREVLI